MHWRLLEAGSHPSSTIHRQIPRIPNLGTMGLSTLNVEERGVECRLGVDKPRSFIDDVN